jgi:3-dehydro-4-phosphotetronate decarboxylase
MTTMTTLSESQAREAICRIGKSLFDRGYVHATAGNVSIRLDEAAGGGFLITPTDACLGFLDPARLARLDVNLQQISGDRASKTIALHDAIYAESRFFDAKTCCVIHTHSSHCVQWSLRVPAAATEPDHTDWLPALTPYFVMKVGHVPHLPYQRPGSPESAQAVRRAIQRFGQRGTPLRAVMLERLGPNVWHDSPSAAMATLEELEETARLMCQITPQGQPAQHALCAPPASLSETEIQDLRTSFGVRW